MPSSSRNSRARQSSKLSPASRLPPGNSHNPPWCAAAGRCVMSSRPSRKTSAAATSTAGAQDAGTPGELRPPAGALGVIGQSRFAFARSGPRAAAYRPMLL